MFRRLRLDESAVEARTDVLTGLRNRRAFHEELGRQFAQRQRQGVHFSLIMIDIDQFKAFNDAHGHWPEIGLCNPSLRRCQEPCVRWTSCSVTVVMNSQFSALDRIFTKPLLEPSEFESGCHAACVSKKRRWTCHDQPRRGRSGPDRSRGRADSACRRSSLRCQTCWSKSSPLAQRVTKSCQRRRSRRGPR